jgi:signal transduction histidine kinase
MDCLIDLLQSANNNNTRLSREELLDLAKDSKSTLNTALQTLNDLLLFDKIESNMLTMELSWTPCYRFLKDCIRPFVRQLQVARVTLNIDLPANLEGVLLYVDQHKLEQVIRNFMGNAVKFTLPDEGYIEVRARLIDGLTFQANKYQCQFEKRDTSGFNTQGQRARNKIDGIEEKMDDEEEEGEGEQSVRSSSGSGSNDEIDEIEQVIEELEGTMHDTDRYDIHSNNANHTDKDRDGDMHENKQTDQWFQQQNSTSESDRLRGRSMSSGTGGYGSSGFGSHGYRKHVPMADRVYLRFEVTDNGAGISPVSYTI